ncbi:hypothetical protein BV898_05416 [Hypsibius exemplaris]|uniref:Uncharacterized protein n=1 Tax=Hypsibius exemplaris TaxID=2072580 RepID=A0A1W0WZF0_HYPEX|nr:hypothetical protein BV898_05416 [Hypsibius exemplaris]
MTAIAIDFGTTGISAATWTAESGFEILSKANSDGTRRRLFWNRSSSTVFRGRGEHRFRCRHLHRLWGRTPYSVPSSDGHSRSSSVIDVDANSLTATVWRTDQDGRSVPYRIASPGHSGNGIDLALMRYVREEWRKVYRVGWASDGTATQCLRLACQEAKLKMAKDKPRTTIQLPNIGEQISLGDSTNVTLNKQEFDGITEPLVTATVEALQNALSAAGLSLCNGVNVFLVGGTTRSLVLIKAIESEAGQVHITPLPDETATLHVPRLDDMICLDLWPAFMGEVQQRDYKGRALLEFDDAFRKFAEFHRCALNDDRARTQVGRQHFVFRNQLPDYNNRGLNFNRSFDRNRLGGNTEIYPSGKRRGTCNLWNRGKACSAPPGTDYPYLHKCGNYNCRGSHKRVDCPMGQSNTNN